MKFTLGWLKSHLDTTASLKEITDRLTAIGLELEGVADPAAKLAPFTVAYVVEAKRHPDADRLQVCIVDTGKEKVQVVCGAPNARTGMKGVFAPAGSFIPGPGIQLKAGNIRGQASNGMLVSMREMGLGNDHDGIIEMPADTPLGVPFAKVLGRDDPMIEIAITPNRADCLGVHGIARDLAASGLGTLRAPVATTVAGKFKSPVGVSFDFPADAQNACPLFVGRYIRGVKNGPSPAWLKQRLEAVGLRSISTLVDITNFFTLDLNRPLHVFDADTLAGSLVVRLARAGESLLALDGKSYTFAGGETVICDNDGVLSLGGVMGGESSGCSDRTVNVYLEVALFDPVRTAATGRRLQILSDARYRFERGLDPAFVMPGMEAATAMILELCGGEASEPVVTGKVPEWRREYALRPERINTLGGLDIPLGEAERILGSLGFETRRRDSQLAVTPPPWRGDVHGEADLVEEVARISGFDKIPAVPLPPVATLPQIGRAHV